MVSSDLSPVSPENQLPFTGLGHDLSAVEHCARRMWLHPCGLVERVATLAYAEPCLWHGYTLQVALGRETRGR